MHSLISERALPDFSRRSYEPEWLDRERAEPEELRRILRDLARFNGAMLGHAPVLRWLRDVVATASANRRLSLLDAGCGHGDLLRAIGRWARRHGVPITLRGIDLNPRTVRIAQAATDPNDAVVFAAADVFRFVPTEPIDLIVSSLLAHHLSDDEIVAFLVWMEQTAARGWLICDLQRHPVPYYVIGLAGRLTPLHPVVFSDGQLSVCRALTRKEWQERLGAAGIPPDRVTIRSFLFRYAIGRLR